MTNMRICVGSWFNTKSMGLDGVDINSEKGNGPMKIDEYTSSFYQHFP